MKNIKFLCKKDYDAKNGCFVKYGDVVNVDMSSTPFKIKVVYHKMRPKYYSRRITEKELEEYFYMYDTIDEIDIPEALLLLSRMVAGCDDETSLKEIQNYVRMRRRRIENV